jgi:hypothetical protein
MRTNRARFVEDAEIELNRAMTERMKREKESIVDRTIHHERSARNVVSHFRESRPAAFGGRSEERSSSEVSIAGKVGEGSTAPVWFEGFPARSTSNFEGSTSHHRQRPGAPLPVVSEFNRSPNDQAAHFDCSVSRGLRYGLLR